MGVPCLTAKRTNYFNLQIVQGVQTDHVTNITQNKRKLQKYEVNFQHIEKSQHQKLNVTSVQICVATDRGHLGLQ